MGIARLRPLALAPPGPGARPATAGRSPPAAALRGEAVDAGTGAALAGARASLVEPGELRGPLAPPPPSPRRARIADGHGRFELPAAAGRRWLLVEAPGYLPELVEVDPGARQVRVALSRPASIRGRILDSVGAPVAGARVRALCPEALDAADAVSLPDGSFRLAGLRPGSWLVGPEGPGPWAPAAVEVASGEAVLLVLRPRAVAPEPAAV